MQSEKYQKKLEKFLLKQEERKRKEKEKKRLKKLKEKKQKDETLTVVLEVPKVKAKKKKVGRPKKRGPKKKRIRRKVIKTYKPKPVYDFKIVTSLNGKQNGHVGQFHDYGEVYQFLDTLKIENEKVVFPRKFLNTGTIIEAKDEYLILEKNRYGDKSDGMVRNEYGKFVVQKIINNNKWIIREKLSRKVEETFWVYGCDPKLDRKTYTWIYENLVIGAIDSAYDIIRIMVYKNKLIIKYDEKPMSLILCKNKSDSIRFYNMLSDKIRKTKNKQIICVGAYNSVSQFRRQLEDDIAELTGWNKIKIQRSTN